ncbi:cilia- and flagella-associated protein 100-like isoform X3 [Mizuhopecten yessoensis]|uniref:Coiled-coil domain-containing protein 37 n=1 Tax=Mizuhopecten yessoensis TaxID=6573 RepID=A0A210PDY3_MIZYE|nr:cilia- and flagella-associated protein 100-like isoform X3 [Mizuhopecten yessoensis]OWF34674.1 Coiled-coil domain-containing protein 37 [Mizuhopecten yessoensis]
MADSPNRSNPGSPDTDVSGKKSRQAISGQSGRVTFPNSAKSGSSRSIMSADDAGTQGNPFKMAPDSDIFVLRDKERQRKKQERLRQRGLHVHEKTTYSSKVNFRTASMIRPADSDEEKEGEDGDKTVSVKDDPQYTIRVTRDRHVEKESLAEYIAKKREMFLVQYSLGVKRDEMKKLEEMAQKEEKKLELAEQYLEEDAAMFDEFLKENDANSAEAVREAENETKAKLEKVAEVKKINTQMMTIKSEISKYEDTLKEYQLYRKFLDSLTPQETREVRDLKRQKRRKEKQREFEKNMQVMKKSGAALDKTKKKLPPKSDTVSKIGSATKKPDQESVMSAMFDSDDDSDEDLDLFFSDPHQLLDIFAELEEQNLSLIQNSQETEEALEEMKHNIKLTKLKMEKETQILKDQIDKLNTQIYKEEARAEDLKIKAKMFSYGEFKAEDQEKMLQALNKKVEEVYRSCIGDNEANISTLQMLTNIENRLEELFEQIETMPQDKVEAAEKAKEKERRLKLREEKIEQQRIHQEERVRKALERAKAEPKKQTGRKLVFRSEPPRHKKKEDERDDQASREEEELAYFFQY